MPLVKRWKAEGLLREADSDDSDNDSNMVEPLNEPWMVEFEQYMNTKRHNTFRHGCVYFTHGGEYMLSDLDPQTIAC